MTEFDDRDAYPWTVVDEESANPGELAKVIGRFPTHDTASWWIGQQDPGDVERGRYGIDGPEEADEKALQELIDRQAETIRRLADYAHALRRESMPADWHGLGEDMLNIIEGRWEDTE